MSQVRKLQVELSEYSDPIVIEGAMQRPLICLKTFLGSEMCVIFFVLKYLVMTSFRGLRRGISTYNAVFNSKVQR